MSEHQIGSSASSSKAIIEFLRVPLKNIQEALGFLKKLPELFQHVLDGISEGADRQISAAGEMEIIKKIANLDSKNYLVTAEKEAVKDFKEQLNSDINYINKEYTKIDNELNDEAKKRVRALDTNLLNLPKLFPRDFITSYSSKITPLMEKIKSDNDLSNYERTILIKNTIDETNLSLNNFIRTRTDFFTKMDQYQQKAQVQNSKIYSLPLFLVETDKGKQMFTAGSINLSKTLDGNSSYKPDEILENYYSNIGKKTSHKGLESLSWNFTKKESNALQNRLISFAEKQYPNNTDYVKKAVKQIFKNSDVKTLKK